MRGKIIKNAIAAAMSIILTVQIAAPGAVFANAYFDDGIVKKSASAGTLVVSLEESGKSTENATVPNEQDYTDDDFKTSENVYEDISLREEATKYFRHSSGKYTVVVYNEPVHYKDSNGEWQDIDNRLSLNRKKLSDSGKATYTPAKSGADIRVPQNFSSGQKITFSKNGYTLGIGIASSESDVISAVDKANLNADLASDKVEIDNNYSDLNASDYISDDNDALNKTVLSNLASEVKYKNVFSGTDLEYIVSSGKIKENIVVNSKQSQYVYNFAMTFDGLTPVQKADGSFYLYKDENSEKPEAIIAAPYMFDADNNISDDVSMELHGNTLTVTADKDWINSENRKFPVVIDPTVITYTSGITDTYVGSTLTGINHNTSILNYAGRDTGLVRRTYMKFDLPTVPENSVITNAVLTLQQTASTDSLETNPYKYFYAIDLTGKGSWSVDSITWNNQPVSKELNAPQSESERIIDFCTMKSGGGNTYDLNLTKSVKAWYEKSGKNNGIMIASSDETKDFMSYFYAADAGTEGVPVIKIEYNSNNGIEDYWSYETTDMGRSGKAYVNKYNGNLTYIHDDISMTGNILPINISHVYNGYTDASYAANLKNMYVGKNFHLNIQEFIKRISSSDPLYASGYRYKYYDGDGTVHLFKTITVDGTQKTALEYDPTTTIKINAGQLVISDIEGNKKYFSLYGTKILKIEDKNGNSQNIEYVGSSCQISKITDSSGREVTFAYNDSNQLISITDPSGRQITYEYSGTDADATLRKITYPDGKSTTFLYTSNKILRITRPDASYTQFTYYITPGCGRRVRRIGKYAKDSSGSVKAQDYITMSYYANADSTLPIAGNTVVTNKNGDATAYMFDDFGRVSDVENQYGQSQYYEYGSDAENTPAEFNNILKESDVSSFAVNLLMNHSFESDDIWTSLQSGDNGTYGYSSDESRYGNRSLKLDMTVNTENIEVDQDFEAESGEVYTFSLYANIPQALTLNGTNGVNFGFVYCIDGEWKSACSEWIGSTSGWEKFEFTARIPSGTLENCHAFVKLSKAEGTVYFDNLQVEKSGGSSKYNFIENSGFKSLYTTSSGDTRADKWSTLSDSSYYEYKKFNGKDCVMIKGDKEKQLNVSQAVILNAEAGETLVIGGKAAAYATIGEARNSRFELNILVFGEENSLIARLSEPFDGSADMGFQTKTISYVLPEKCTKIYYRLNYYNQINPVYFTDAFVYVGGNDESYGYNESGLLIKSTDSEGKTVSYSYDDNNLKTVKQTVSGVEQTVAEYTYDADNNVSQITNNVGSKVKYEYNNGVVTSRSVEEKGENPSSATESMTYIQSGNYISSYTDASGGVTTFYYDNNNTALKGLVEKIVDPNDNETRYTYDPNTDELLSVSGNADTSSVSSTGFVYENDLVKSITHNGDTYSYGRDSLGRITASEINGQTLVSTVYDSRNRLASQTYANGSVYTPVYDSRDRLAGDNWNGTVLSDYYYDEKDRISQYKDNVTNVTYRYSYALYDLPFRVVGSDGTKSIYDYDRSGAISNFTFLKDCDIIYNARYKNNEKGNPTDTVISTFNNTLLHYNYDNSERLSGWSCGPVISSVTYKTALSGDLGAGNLVQNYKNGGRDGETYQNYTYDYDQNQNITNVTESTQNKTVSYAYDGLDRLISESNGTDTYTYSYDVGGNIQSVTKNGAVTGTFAYGGANHDRLSSFNGKAVTYDANGNPLSYDGYTYSWQRGSQLSGISGNGKTVSYVYDSQGRRVQKTVDGITTTYVYSGDMLISQSDGTNTLGFAYDSQGMAIGFKYGGNYYYYMRDLLGNVTAVADADGNLVAEYSYDAYGNLLSSSGALANINPIRYRGYYYDSETSFYYLKTRYYNPQWRRFINADSLFIAGDIITGCNMYAYCEDNPIMNTDSNGMAPSADSIRKTSKVISWVIFPETVAFFAVANLVVLPKVKDVIESDGWVDDKPGNDFASTNTADKVVPYLKVAADTCLPLIGGDYTFKEKTGLRHFMPSNMALGAPWAGYLLGFEKSRYGKGLYRHTNYTTVEGKYMWQSQVGYSWLYDLVFSMGGPTQRLMMKFDAVTGGKTIHYIIWCWKADYWNLGAGAEIGLYYTDSDESADNNYYLISEDLTLHVNMVINYTTVWGKVVELNNFHQTNWWVTSFTPGIQEPDIDRLDVDIDVRFVGSDYYKLMRSFYEKWSEHRADDTLDYKYATMLPYANKVKPKDHENHPKCTKQPALCTCVCPLGSSACAKPCSYYTKKCKASDASKGCRHYGDYDNGFQFKISY